MILGSRVNRLKQYHLQSVGLKDQALVTRQWIFRGVHTQLNRVRSRSLSPRDGLGGSGFWPFFPARFSGLLVPLFILVCTPSPSSTCRIDFSTTDTCPISPYPKWLGVVVKVEEHGSVRCRMFYCNSGSLLLVLFRTVITLPFRGIYGMPSRSSSSAISLDRPRLSWCVLCPISPRRRPWALT